MSAACDLILLNGQSVSNHIKKMRAPCQITDTCIKKIQLQRSQIHSHTRRFSLWRSFTYTQQLITKWGNVVSRQQAYQKSPHSTTNNRPGEYFFWTISVPTYFTGFLYIQSYIYIYPIIKTCLVLYEIVFMDMCIHIYVLHTYKYCHT